MRLSEDSGNQDLVTWESIGQCVLGSVMQKSIAVESGCNCSNSL